MLDTIFNRRSIRKYLDKPVEEDKLRTILRAAMYAPSARDCRPWHFIVVKDRGMIERFMQLQPYSKMLAQAPVLILVCGDQGREAAPGYFMEDCGAAVQNLLLAAHELGLGACWLGIAPVPGADAAHRRAVRPAAGHCRLLRRGGRLPGRSAPGAGTL